MNRGGALRRKATRTQPPTREASRMAGAVASQGLNAASSLVIQLVGARSLGIAGFSSFTLIYSVLIALTALYSGWVGDSITVLDRSRQRERSGIAASICAWLGTAVVIGLVCGSMAGHSTTLRIEVAALLAVWLVEETGRRIFVARRSYWALTGNDLIYNCVALVSMVFVVGVHGELTIQTLLWCMIAGSGAAVLASLISLPRSETRFPRPTMAGFRDVAAFGAWRSLSVGIRPFGLLVARVMIAASFGAAALSSTQISWLLLAPAMVLLNGAALFLLPFFRGREASGARVRFADIRRAAVRLSLCAAAWGVVAIALSHRLVAVLAAGSGPHFTASGTIMLGWTVYIVALAVAMPAAAALVSIRRPRVLLATQLVEIVVGLALVAAGCTFGSYVFVPYALAIGVAIGAGVAYRKVYRLLSVAPLSAHAPGHQDVTLPLGGTSTRSVPSGI